MSQPPQDRSPEQPPAGQAPPQGFAQQGFPGGPYGPVPLGGDFGPGGPGPNGPGPRQVGPKKRTGLGVLVGTGALALVLVVVAVAVDLGGRDDTAGGSGRPTTGGGPAPAAAAASDAVTGYFDALAAGDVAAAVAFAADPASVDTTYLTPAVLASSAARAPLTDVHVTPTPDPDATSVAVSYRLGSIPVSTDVEVVRADDDVWKLVSVASLVDLTSVADASVPMKINGAEIDRTTFGLLPGVYAFTTSSKYVDLGASADLVVRYPSDAPDTTRIAPRISPAGRAAALKAVKKSWSGCLDERAQRPRGCPNQFSYKDYEFRDGTVRWSRKGSDPFEGIKVAYADTTTLQYRVKRDLALRGTCTASGRTGTCTGTLEDKGSSRALAEARRSGEKMTVRWFV